jgi:hypothetical protein
MCGGFTRRLPFTPENPPYQGRRVQRRWSFCETVGTKPNLSGGNLAGGAVKSKERGFRLPVSPHSKA